MVTDKLLSSNQDFLSDLIKELVAFEEDLKEQLQQSIRIRKLKVRTAFAN